MAGEFVTLVLSETSPPNDCGITVFHFLCTSFHLDKGLKGYNFCHDITVIVCTNCIWPAGGYWSLCITNAWSDSPAVSLFIISAIVCQVRDLLVSLEIFMIVNDLLISWHFLVIFQLTQNMANMNVGGPGYGGEIDLDSLPPPPPELLQQQYLYGTVPDSRQQGVYNQFPHSHGQASHGFTPGTGNVPMPPPQKAGISNIPPSKPIQVYIVF